MTDNELLSALSDMLDDKLDKKLDEKFDEKLKPIKDDIKILKDDMKIVKGDIKALQDDMITVKTDIKSLQDDMITVKADIKSLQDDMITVKADIKGLKDKMEHVENKLNIISIEHENIIIPRLNEIEQCYLSTYKRYVDTTEMMEKKMEMFDVVWVTVEGHSEQILELQKLRKTS